MDIDCDRAVPCHRDFQLLGAVILIVVLTALLITALCCWFYDVQGLKQSNSCERTENSR